MLRLQTPLPERYTSADEDELASMIGAAKAALGPRVFILGHHYQRDEVMRHMGSQLREVAREAGCTHEMAREFGNAMEQAIRECVAEIEASGGGTVGTA